MEPPSRVSSVKSGAAKPMRGLGGPLYAGAASPGRESTVQAAPRTRTASMAITGGSVINRRNKGSRGIGCARMGGRLGWRRRSAVSDVCLRWQLQPEGRERKANVRHEEHQGDDQAEHAEHKENHDEDGHGQSEKRTQEQADHQHSG